ncbi:hypothetical protein PVAG01_07627 [Phlyctema vagabunda]|uniref:Carrier domain-containing protein n=1 Tax=Phlyctema vagabunda TaxID=108571 RepID=A0ABR4PCY9_9HELO
MPSLLTEVGDKMILGSTKQDKASDTLSRGTEVFLNEESADTKPIFDSLDIDRPYPKFSGLSDEDESRIRSWNSNVRPSVNRRLHHAFSERVLVHPEAPAVHAWDGELTYAELDDLSSRLAYHISHLVKHQGNHTRVAFCFEKSKIAIVSMLAILKADCTCVPLSDTMEEDAMPKMISDIDPGLICTSGLYPHRFSTMDRTTLIVNSNLLVGLEPQTRFGTEPKECTPFIHYTAGRTGRPKIVLQQHAALHTGILSLGETMAYNNYSRVLQYVPYTSNMSVGDIFGCFLHGGCLVVPSQEHISTDLTGVINEYDVTHAYLTPDAARSIEQYEIVQLICLALGGDSLTTDDVESWSIQAELVKVYGTVESSVWVSASKSPSSNVFLPSNIGTSSSASLWIVDPTDVHKLLPIGCVGELVIGGPVLANGYLNDNARDTEAFTSSPSWAFLSQQQDNHRFFRTGDLVKYLEDGEIEFVGRKSLTTDPVSSDEIEDIYPLTPMQEGLFALSIKEPGAFIKQHIFTLPPTLDTARFKEAWTQVIAKCSVLRTRVVMNDANELNQVVIRSSPEFAELSNLGAYLTDDLHETMPLGSSLARFAIVEEEAAAYFVLTSHHAIYDGWTLSSIFDLVEQAYQYKELSSTVSFNAFVDYLRTMDTAQQDKYWKAQMEDASMTQFPSLPSTSYQPNPRQVYTREARFTRLKGSTITTSNLVRAAWALTLSLYTGSHDVVFGETLSGRNVSVKGIHSLIGPTITTVPIRVKIDRGTFSSQYLQQIQDKSIEMMAFEHAGLRRIMQLSESARTACAFQTSIIVQAATEATGLERLGCRRYNDMLDSYQPYALNVEFELHASGGTVITSFDDQVIDRLQVQRTIAQFCQILQKLSLEEAAVTVGDLATITPEDLTEIRQWNQTPPAPLHECVHEAFQRQVALNPSAEAIVSWDGSFSYTELDELSTILADHLIDLNVTLEMVVPLCFDKSRWAVVAMLAVLKSGGACLSLDPSHPVDRLRSLVSTVEGNIILVAESHKSKFIDSVDVIITVDEELFNWLPNAHRPLAKSTSPDNLAFLIFTTGTTGAPKGIEWEHKGVCSASREHAAVFKVGPGSRCLQFTAFAADVHIADIFTALMYGGCCCIPSEEERMGHIPNAIQRMQANYAYLTPTVVTLFHPDDVPTLKKIALGGEVLTQENARTWAGKMFVINDYSTCEAGNWATYQHVLPDTLEPSNIGRPVGTCAWLVDPNDFNRLAPIGSVGELFIEGPAVARGYYKDAERTKTAFGVTPAWAYTERGSTRRLYRTGDLLRYNSDGTLVFNERKDTQVKIRGQRLEIKGVERKLSEIATVKISAIFFPTEGLCSKRLVAVLCLKQLSEETGLNEIRIVGEEAQGLASSTISEIRDKLAESLAAWMIPSLWIVVEEMPTNGSGKLDRKKLSTFVEEISEGTLEQVSKLMIEEDFQEPETEIEKTLRRIISLVLKISAEQISSTSSFLRLGGDSITAMHVMSHCHKEGVLISVKDILQSQTITELASHAQQPADEEINTDKDDYKLVSNSISTNHLQLFNQTDLESIYKTIQSQTSIDSSAVEDIFEATDYQAVALAQAMLRHRGDLTYHTFSIKTPVDRSRLGEACRIVTQAHPNLRSTFVSHHRQIFQVVSKLSCIDFQSYSSGTSVDALIEDDLEKGMSPAGSLVWFKAVESERKATLVVRLPHCLYDATTRARLASDLWQVYEHGTATGSSIESPKFLELRLENRPLAEQYWREHLAGSVPTQILHRTSPNFTCSRQTTVQDEISVNSLKRHGITMSTVVTAAWTLVLAQISRRQDITFGETVSGRNVSSLNGGELENVCVNVVPLRVKIQPGCTVSDLLRDVQAKQLARMPFEFLGTASIIERCTDWPKWTQLGSVLNHASLAEEEEEDENECVGAVRDEGIRGTINASADINIMTHPLSASRLKIKMVFDRSSLPSDYASLIFQRYCSLIQEMTADPDVMRIEQLSEPWTANAIPLSHTAPENSSACKPLSVTLLKLREIEVLVRKAWREVLGPFEGEIAIDVPFYELWPSLVAAAHLAFVYEPLGLKLEMEDVLQAPTVDDQVALLCARFSG